MNRQLTHALEHVGLFNHRTFSRLQHADAVIGIAHGLVQAADLCGHVGADGQTCCVVASGVDLGAGRQLLHGLGQAAVVHFECVLRKQGVDVGVDGGHVSSLSKMG